MTAFRTVVYGWIYISLALLGALTLLAFAGWIAEAWRTHRARVARHNELLRRVQARRAAHHPGLPTRAPCVVPAQRGRTVAARPTPRRPAPFPPAA